MSGALLLKRSAALLRLLRSSSSLLDGGTCRPASAVASVALAACTTLPWSSSTVSEKLSTSCCRQRTERGTPSSTTSQRSTRASSASTFVCSTCSLLRSLCRSESGYGPRPPPRLLDVERSRRPCGCSTTKRACRAVRAASSRIQRTARDVLAWSESRMAARRASPRRARRRPKVLGGLGAALRAAVSKVSAARPLPPAPPVPLLPPQAQLHVDAASDRQRGARRAAVGIDVSARALVPSGEEARGAGGAPRSSRAAAELRGRGHAAFMPSPRNAVRTASVASGSSA